MKLFIACFMTGVLFLTSGNSQVVRDKNLFAKNLAFIFQQRSNGFDSLMGEEIDGAYKPTVLLPGATENFISFNRVYVALFNCPDSTAAVSFYRELKELLGLSASLYNAKPRFRQIYTTDPFFEEFYFSDSRVFTNEGSTIQLIGESPENNEKEEEEEENNGTKSAKKAKKIFTVHLGIKPGVSICSYTGGEPRLNDSELNTFIAGVALGKDTALKNIRINQRIQPGKIIYDSKIGLKGFKTIITEIRKDKVSGFNISATRKYLMDEQSFLKAVDSFVLKLKSAVPSNYCYEVFNEEDGGRVEIKPVPYLKNSGNEAEIQLRYSAEKGRKNEYTMEIYIYRKMSKRE